MAASPTHSLDATPIAPSLESFAASKPALSSSSHTSRGEWSNASCSSLGGDHSGGGANEDDEQHGLGLSFGFPSPPSDDNNGDCTPVRTPSRSNRNSVAATPVVPPRPPRRLGSANGLNAESGSSSGAAPTQHVVGGLARNASMSRARSTSTSSRQRQRAVSSGSASAARSAAAASRSPRTRKAKEMDLGGQIDLAMSFVAEGPFQPPPLPPQAQALKAAHAQPVAAPAAAVASGSQPRPLSSSTAASSARTDTQEAFKAALAAIGRSVADAQARSVDGTSAFAAAAPSDPDDEALLSTLRALAEAEAPPFDLLRPESSASMVSTLSGGSYASSTASGSGRLTWGDALRRGTGVTTSIARTRDGSAEADADAPAVAEETTRSKFRRARLGGGYHPASRPASRGASRRPSGLLTSASTPEGALGRIALPYAGEMSASSSGDSWRLDGTPQAEDLRRASRALEEEEEVLLSASGHSHPACDEGVDELDGTLPGIQHAPLSEGIAREAALRERAEREAQASYNEAKRTEAESVALRAGIKWLLASHEAVTQQLTAALEAPRPAPPPPPVETLSWLQYAPSSPPATEAAPSIAPSTRSRSRSILRAFSRPKDAQNKVNAFITGSSAPGMGVSMPSNRLSVMPDAALMKRNQGQAEIAAALSRFTGAREGSLRAKEVSPRAYLRAMPEDDGDMVDASQPWTAGWGASSSGDLTRMSMDRKSRARADSSAKGSAGPHSPRTSSCGGLLPPGLPDESDMEALKLALAQSRMATAHAEQEKRRLGEQIDELTSRTAVENNERLRIERVKIAGLEKEVEGLRAQLSRTARKGAGGDAITEGAIDEAEAGMMEAVKEAAMATAEAEEEAARLREQMEGLESRCNVLEEALYHAVAAVAHTRMESGGVDVSADPAIVAAQMWDDAEASFDPPAAPPASSSLPESESSGTQVTHGAAPASVPAPPTRALPQPLSMDNLKQRAEAGTPTSPAESIGTADDAASLVLPRRRFSDSMTSFYSADGGRSPLSTYGAIEYADDDEERAVVSPVSDIASPRIPNGLVNALHSRSPSEARASPDVASPSATTAERRGASIAPLILARTQNGPPLYSPSMPNSAATFKRLSRGLEAPDRDLPPRPPEPSSPLPPPPMSPGGSFSRSPDPSAGQLPPLPGSASSSRPISYSRGAPGFAASPVSEHASRPPWATSSLSEASTTSRTDTSSPASFANSSTSPVMATKGMAAQGSARLGLYSLPQLSTVGRLEPEHGGNARYSAPFSVSPLAEPDAGAEGEPLELLPDVEYAHDADQFDADPVKLARHSSISSTKSKRLTKEAKLAARNRTRSATNKMRSSIASTEAPSFASSGSGESSGDAARRIAQATLLGSQIRRGGFGRSTRSISSISQKRSDMPSIADMPSTASITSGAARWTAPRSSSSSHHSVPSTPTDLMHSPRSPHSPTASRSGSSSTIAGSESFTRRRNYGSQLRESPRVGL